MIDHRNRKFDSFVMVFSSRVVAVFMLWWPIFFNSTIIRVESKNDQTILIDISNAKSEVGLLLSAESFL